ncbi:putative spermidine/putrescine transport system permease protein [Tistlia consotensis]|uniref:Putative spermidine/putrescine transport system permease protein n=1 Tax=Tistlia consotensis USBA 355 TaxID=560819 RepID=A0A1Y6B3W2_9PROT|nr:ABC transporter permease [Tistlia consotensis]SME88685.1 putative spermidine/putrescine transport system permease protein [Tistlia consotensis USBA 355]SNR25244.1 putative spermidine/putrescine transport system permease protein [Tistlia consotensis]
MAQATIDELQGLTTADGTPLRRALHRAERRAKIRAFLLVTPLLVFLAVTFIYPIAQMLWRSIYDDTIVTLLPNTVTAFKDWTDRDQLPPESVFAAFAVDMKQTREDRTIGQVATRVNFEEGGLRSIFTRTARHIDDAKNVTSWRDWFIQENPDWGKLNTWATIERLGHAYSILQYLAATDRQYDDHGNIVMAPEETQIYVPIFIRTLWMSLLVTLLTLLLGYPISYFLATLPIRTSNLLMIMVLLPFWTSLLVRTTSWIVILGKEGVLNDILVWLGLISDDGRIQMIYNQTGTLVAMTQILLPFMVLPLYSVMKTISPSYMRAAMSLGAPRFLAFWKVYAPNTLPGVGAGALLVFILSIGYYITPALVGGRTGQMISNFIAFHMQKSLNWGLAAALGGILLAGVLLLYALYNRLVGVEKLSLG